MYDDFLSLINHAESTNQKPTKWVVGAGVVEAVMEDLLPAGASYEGKDIQFMGIPMERSVCLPDGRVTLKCGRWSAGGFSIGEPT